MIVINNIDDKRFSFNGIKYFKNFTPHVVDENIRIVNTYDSTFPLLNWTPYDQFEVNGSTFNNVSDLQTALLPVLYNKVINVVQQLTYQTLAEFNAVSPVPDNGTPFIVANDPNEENNGEWSVQGGVAVQNARTVENIVERTKNISTTLIKNKIRFKNI